MSVWTEEAVRASVDQAILDTRTETLRQVAEWHLYEAQKEENIINNTAYQCGSIGVRNTHSNSYDFFKKLSLNGSVLDVDEIRKKDMEDFMARGRQKGFTVYEVIIAIVVVGFVGGVAIPKFLNTIERDECADGKQSVCDQLHIQNPKLQTIASLAGAVPPAAPAPQKMLFDSMADKHKVDAKKWQHVKGRVVKVFEDTKRNNYQIVLSLENGTAMTFVVGTIVEKGTTVCVAMSPDRSASQDRIILCK